MRYPTRVLSGSGVFLHPVFPGGHSSALPAQLSHSALVPRAFPAFQIPSFRRLRCSSAAAAEPLRLRIHKAAVVQPDRKSSSRLCLTYIPLHMASEEDVGILCYANSVPGFQGILKQRYSDFIVNEIDLNGNVIQLTDLQVPPELLKEETWFPAHETLKNGAGNGTQASGPDRFETSLSSGHALLEDFRSLAGDTNAELLETMLAKVDSGEVNELAPILLAADAEKTHRTEIHSFFKSRLPSLVTDTVDGPDETSKCIRIRYFKTKQRGSRESRSGQKRGHDDWKSRDSDSKRMKDDQPFDSRGADNWPADREKYLQFYLYKENKDTQDALSVIGRMLGLQSKSFGFAGTKDKRAVTTQRVTVFKQPASKVAALNDRLYGIKVGNYSYVKEALVLGQLSGNRFAITLRGVVADNDVTILHAAEGLHETGFINYFGLQRFGSGSILTHSVGAALLRGEWKRAVELILSPRAGEQLEISEARNYFKRTSDIDGALVRMPRYLLAERAVLLSLKRNPANFLLAITSIPRPVRLLYVHSYQSLLWNHAASFRAKKYGVEDVVEGDLVYYDEVESNDANNFVTDVDLETVVTDGDGDILGEMDIVEEPSSADQHRKARLVTSEDVKLGKYHVSDVLLPLPGYMMLYPGHETANVYQELAAKDNLDLYSSKHNVKEFSITCLGGGYRHFIERPRNLEWKVLKYVDPTIPLAETDLDMLLEKQGSSSNGAVSCGECVEDSSDQKTALQLSFELPSSCYATMVIRELLKTSTSVSFHKSLNELPTSQQGRTGADGLMPGAARLELAGSGGH